MCIGIKKLPLLSGSLMSVDEVERVLLYSLESSVSSNEQKRSEVNARSLFLDFNVIIFITFLVLEIDCRSGGKD